MFLGEQGVIVGGGPTYNVGVQINLSNSDSLQSIGVSPRAKSVPEVLTHSLEVMYEGILHVL